MRTHSRSTRSVVTVLVALLVLSLAAVRAVASSIEVFACEPEWAALVGEIAGPRVSVFSATTAFQDPHHIEARPSLIARARNAQLLVCTGAELEIGWLPLVQRRSGNRVIQDGADGVFYAAEVVERIEIPDQVDRSQGDVHAGGNPHVHLDPRRLLPIASALVDRLVAIDPEGAAYYRERNASFQTRWGTAMTRWEQRAAGLKGVPVIVHHRSFSYLFDWLGINTVGDLEPHPGVPPTSRHLARLATGSLDPSPQMVVQASYQQSEGANWLAKRLDIPVVTLPSTVGGSDAAQDLFLLFDDIINRLVRLD